MGKAGHGVVFSPTSFDAIQYQHPKNGENQLLLCFVIVGDTVVQADNAALTKPPTRGNN